MSSLDGINSSSSALMHGMHKGGHRMHRPNPSEMSDQLFAQLDTKGQGFIEKSDLQSAFAQLSSSRGGSDNTVSVDDVFKQLDSDGDGKVTKDEMSNSLKKLADELDSQFNQMRMAGGMPPPPPPDGGKNGAGLTKDQLGDMASDLSATDSKRAHLMSNLFAHFDKADTDGNGKVSFKEAMIFDQQNQISAMASADSSSSSSTNNDSSIMKRIIELIHAYNSNNGSATGGAGTVSVLA